MNYCETCTHWARRVKSPVDVGRCRALGPGGSNMLTVVPRAEVVLLTRERFGCVLHEAKGKETIQ